MEQKPTEQKKEKKPVEQEAQPAVPTDVEVEKPAAHLQLTADDFDDSEEPEELPIAGVQSLVQRLVDHEVDDADKYDYADTYSQLTADELVESNEQAYDG